MNLTMIFEQTRAYRENLAHAEYLSDTKEDRSYYITRGVVYLYQGQCFAWSQYLKEPCEYCPSVIAVSVEGECLQAVGGNTQDGAAKWLPLDSEVTA